MDRRLFLLSLPLVPSLAFAQPSTSVAEYIAANGAEAVFAAIKRDAEPGKKFAAGWLKLARRAGVASCLLSACNDLQLRTVGEVKRYAEGCIESYEQVQGLIPAIDLDPTNLVPWSTIIAAAGQQFTLAGAGDPRKFQADNMNATYFRLPYSKIVELAGKFPQRDADFWRADLCEAKVRALRGWLDTQGYGNAAVGLAGLFLYQWGQFRKAHAVACAVDDSNRIWLIDGAVYPATHCKFAGNDYATSSKLAAFNF